MVYYHMYSAYMTKKNTTLFYYFYVPSAIQQNTEYVCKKTSSPLMFYNLLTKSSSLFTTITVL